MKQKTSNNPYEFFQILALGECSMTGLKTQNSCLKIQTSDRLHPSQDPADPPFALVKNTKGKQGIDDELVND